MASRAPWRARVEAADWDMIRADLDTYGCALIGPLLTAGEANEIAALYPVDSRFRSTIDMRRYRFGDGEYRYLAEPYPDAVVALKQALYPRMLPIARDWWLKLRRDTPWPEHLDEWLDMCHAAGQTKSTAILRAQSRATVTLIPHGHGMVFTTRDRPIEAKRAWSAAPVRHGISRIRSGERLALGMVFHDAA